MSYGYIGSMKARPGHRDEVVSILSGSAEGLRQAGCQLYVISISNSDEETIWVTEIWGTKEQHDSSLRLPETRAAIGKAMPMLTDEFTSHETTVIGGVGVRPS